MMFPYPPRSYTLKGPALGQARLLRKSFPTRGWVTGIWDSSSKARNWRPGFACSRVEGAVRRQANSLIVDTLSRASPWKPDSLGNNSKPRQVISLPLCLTQFWTCFDISPFFFYFFLSVSEEKLTAGLIRGKVRCWLVTKPLAKAETLSGTSSLEVSASWNEWQTGVPPLTSNSASPSPWWGRTQEARQKRVKTLWRLSKQQGSKLLHIKCTDSLWEEWVG